MKKIASLLLALMLIASMIPMVVGANDFILPNGTNQGFKYYSKLDDSTVGTVELIGSQSNQPNQSKEDAEPDVSKEVHEPGKHKYSVRYNNKYHWLGCPCGCQISMEHHIDPKDAENDYCTCGFHFSSNADLVTLWVDGCPCIKDFSKNKTEYTLKAYTYKDVKEVKISTRTADSQATVELPEDLTLKEGENVIPVKVIAGNQRDTKTYTLTIIKESK